MLIFAVSSTFRVKCNMKLITTELSKLECSAMSGISTAQCKYYAKRLIVISGFVSLLIICLYPGKFAVHSYPSIQQNDIPANLVPNPAAIRHAAASKVPLCKLPDNQSNAMLYPNVSVSPAFLEQLAKLQLLEVGGYWKPKHCIAQYQVVIIVPYRKREEQLRIFIAFMHSFLQQQLLEYRIVVVEQVPNTPFNRAKLFNVGFTEAMKLNNFHCIIFHDVDLIPQKLSNIYACTHCPRHMSSSLNTFRYVLPYKNLFGGVIAMTKEQFEFVNGFSNAFFGWGGEDDDFQNRLSSKGLLLCRFEPSVSRYLMLSHRKEKPSESRFVNLISGSTRFHSDGLNNLKYVIINSKETNLYTWFLVQI